MNVNKNTERMQLLDDAWNNQDWETFEKYHTADTVVYWSGRTEATTGRSDHRAEAIEFFKTFPDNRVHNRPYKILFGDGDWTCSVARFTGTMTGAMKTPDGGEIAPTGKSFEVEFCTVALWKDGAIAEERLFFDNESLMKQIGLA